MVDEGEVSKNQICISSQVYYSVRCRTIAGEF